MEKRVYGRNGDRISMVGFGGILLSKEEPSEADRLVAKAIDRGVNYFDVAPSYGNAEERLGPALAPFRSSVFLACKTTERSAEGSKKELENSLKVLQTDHFDLYQLHSVTTSEDVEQIFGPSGALETFVRAREKGMVRNLGFSAHSEEAALAVMDRFDFESVLLPINWVAWNQGDFGSKTVTRAKEKGMTVLALKTMAKRKWMENEEREWTKTWYRPVESYEKAKRAVGFTFSLPVTAGPCPGHEQLFDWMCDAADEFQPLTDEEKKTTEELSQGLDPIFSNYETRWK